MRAGGLDIVHKNSKLIQDKALRETVLKLASGFECDTVPLLPNLRQSVIHNDLNDYNLLAGGGDDMYARGQSIVGLIDFGDMVRSYTIGDLAVAILYYSGKGRSAVCSRSNRQRLSRRSPA